MALGDTGRAIGAVTRMLHDHLVAHSGVTASDVTIGKPEPPAGAPATSRLNLFLYEVYFDPSMRNISLDTGQPPPLWLGLKYLVTAFDEAGDSDSPEAHDFLGEGLRALQEFAFLPLTGLPANVVTALNDNPEPLKLTFDESSSDLLSKLMQGSDEKYRFSVAFEVRPVLIAQGEAPSYSLLVGVNYDAGGAILGEEGIHIPVIPSMGPTIREVSPAQFEAGETVTIRGDDLHLSGLSVHLGPVELGITAQQPDRLQCLVDGNIPGGAVISAGDHTVSVGQMLPTGRRRFSNLLVGGLMPVLTTVAPVAVNHVDPLDPASNVFGELDLTGALLGTDSDDAFVALYRDGSVVRMFDTFVAIPPPPPPPPIVPQTLRRLQIPEASAVPPGQYLVILRVNGRQAKRSPSVNLV